MAMKRAFEPCLININTEEAHSSSEDQGPSSQMSTPYKRFKYSPKDLANKRPPDCIHCLPDEVLVKIFKMLPIRKRIQSERVCKKWLAPLDESWKNVRHLKMVHFARPKTLSLDKQVARAVWLRAGPHVRSVSFSGLKPDRRDERRFRGALHPSLFWEFGRTEFPQLKEVDLSRICVDSVVAVELFDYLTDLEIVHLPQITVPDQATLNDIDSGNVPVSESIERLLVRCPTLKKLFVKRPGTNYQFLNALSETLEVLNVQDCGLNAYAVPLDEMLDGDAKFTNLVELRLQGCRCEHFPMDKLVQSAPNLKLLDIRGVSCENMEKVETVAQLRQLETLQLCGAVVQQVQGQGQAPVEDTLIQAITQYNAPVRHTLKHFAFSGEKLSNRRLLHRICRLRQLEHLDIGAVSVLDRRSVLAMAVCPQLNRIELNTNPFPYSLPWLYI